MIFNADFGCFLVKLLVRLSLLERSLPFLVMLSPAYSQVDLRRSTQSARECFFSNA